jgi:hypothetical protein
MSDFAFKPSHLFWLFCTKVQEAEGEKSGVVPKAVTIEMAKEHYARATQLTREAINAATKNIGIQLE